MSGTRIEIEKRGSITMYRAQYLSVGAWEDIRINPFSSIEGYNTFDKNVAKRAIDTYLNKVKKVEKTYEDYPLTEPSTTEERFS